MEPLQNTHDVASLDYDGDFPRRTLVRPSTPMLLYRDISYRDRYYARLAEIDEWAIANCPNVLTYRVMAMLVVVFACDSDAVFFKLRWHQ